MIPGESFDREKQLIINETVIINEKAGALLFLERRVVEGYFRMQLAQRPRWRNNTLQTVFVT